MPVRITPSNEFTDSIIDILENMNIEVETLGEQEIWYIMLGNTRGYKYRQKNIGLTQDVDIDIPFPVSHQFHSSTNRMTK